jgi:hypothetical protein
VLTAQHEKTIFTSFHLDGSEAFPFQAIYYGASGFCLILDQQNPGPAGSIHWVGLHLCGISGSNYRCELWRELAMATNPFLVVDG